MSDSHLTQLKYQQLLRNLKTTVEGLLVTQVADVWCIYGGLNRLHVDVDKIFKDGSRILTDDGLSGLSDYWNFIQGLEWLQPDSSKSTFSLDSDYKPHLPQKIKSDKASIWLYRSLENHSLSQKLSWLLSDKTHLLSCYQPTAFLCQESYAEATLICLRAVERNQPSLISEIKPNLFVVNSNTSGYHKMHRRCSSFPDARLKNIKDDSEKHRTFSFDVTLEAYEEKSLKPLPIQVKLRTWNSLPNIRNITSKMRSRSNTQSYTTPNTPIHNLEKLSPSIFEVDYDKLQKHTQKVRMSKKNCIKRTDRLNTAKNDSKNINIPDNGQPKVIKHVLINNYNIIEHTPPLSSSQSSGTVITEVKIGKPKSPSRISNIARSPIEYSFLMELSGISGEKDFKKQPKKTFIEDGGMSVLPMATGYFPRPTKGQTLTSFLTSSQFARTNAELDRENAHFSISEAMISAMEQIRCRKDLKLADEQQDDSDEEINDLKQRIRLRRRQKIEEKQRKIMTASLLSDGRTDTTTTEASPSSFSSSAGSFSDTFSSEEDVDDIEIDETSNLSESRGLSMSMASLFSEAELLKRPRGIPDGASDVLSAEGVALSLISRFSEKQLPRASDLEWLVSEEDAPQALLPLPKSWPVSPDDDHEIPPATPLRGTREWAPPRPQIIFTLHPSIPRKVLMAKQNYRCAGCAMRVAPKYASKFRYCNYLGRYFCTGCHANQLAIIPAKVIQKWDFTRYAVSTFSYRLLEQMNTDPLFRIFELNKSIGKHSRNLQTCKKFRQGLSYLKDFILTCRFAEAIQEYLKTEHSYIFNDPDIYSMEDLTNVRNGEMKNKLKCLVDVCCRHTSECELCLARGFICEICNSKEVLFPWQMRTVMRCPKCGCCFHLKCWDNNGAVCLKCRRITKRRESMLSSTDMDAILPND